MPVPFTYDLSTAVGQVRMLLADTDEDTAAFSDAELTALLAMNGNSVVRSAGKAYYILAGDKAKIAVRIGRGSTNEDLTSVAKELRESGKALLEQAVDEDVDGPLEAWITPGITPFQDRRNRILGRRGEPRDFGDLDKVYP